MPEQSEKSRSLIPLYIMIILFYVVASFQGGDESILAESVSKESDFQVSLAEGVNYELWIENPDGPEKINVTISKDSYIAYQNIFVLTDSGKSYFPYHPEFTVKEGGIYHVHAKPFNSGNFSLKITRP